MRHTVFTSDTTPAANKVQLELLRRMSPRQRLQRTFAWSRQLKQMSFVAIRRSHPNLDENGIRLKFIETTYGKALADRICIGPGNPRLNEYEELVAALRPVVNALQRLGVRHYVGGSVASSFHGAARSTMDVDLVCELTEIEIPEFIRWLGSDYYLSETAICEAVKRKGCFNLIHLSSSFKVDIFISRGRPFDVEAMERASRRAIGGDADDRASDCDRGGFDDQQTRVVLADGRSLGAHNGTTCRDCSLCTRTTSIAITWNEPPNRWASNTCCSDFSRRDIDQEFRGAASHGSRCSAKSVTLATEMDRQPDGGLVRRRPLHAVPVVGGNEQIVARFQVRDMVLKLQPRRSAQQDDPLVLILVVPKIFRAAVSGGNDLLDTDVSRLCQDLDQFFGKVAGEVRQEVVTSHVGLVLWRRRPPDTDLKSTGGWRRSVGRLRCGSTNSGKWSLRIS